MTFGDAASRKHNEKGCVMPFYPSFGEKSKEAEVIQLLAHFAEPLITLGGKYPQSFNTDRVSKCLFNDCWLWNSSADVCPIALSVFLLIGIGHN